MALAMARVTDGFSGHMQYQNVQLALADDLHCVHYDMLVLGNNPANMAQMSDEKWQQTAHQLLPALLC